MPQILETTSFPVEDLLRVLESANEERLKQFVDGVYIGAAVEVFVGGNVSESEASQIADRLYAIFPRTGTVADIYPVRLSN